MQQVQDERKGRMISLVVCEHMICQYGETYVVKESLKEHDAEIRRQTIDEFARAYEKVEVYGCIGCKHLEDDVHCWECIAEQLKEKKGEQE